MKRRVFLANSAGALAVLCAVRTVRAQDDSARRGPFAIAIENLAGKLERDYVIPVAGARYAAMLRANLARGSYADFAAAESLAARLTADLRAVVADGHLRVVSDGSASPGRAAAPGAGPRVRPRPGEAPVPESKWIADGVAYIRFLELSGSPQSLTAVEEFAREHVRARALIIDARTLPGGGMDEMNVLFPYLFAQETTLVAMEIAQRFVDERGPPPDAGGKLRVVAAPAGVFRREHFVIPHATEHRLFDVPVFCLTSSRTASAGEHLVLALKRTHRATVIGGRTAGGNHFGGFEDLGQGLSAFIPVGRTIDPDTGQDWEGVGIAPDVEVPADAALEEALRRASS